MEENPIRVPLGVSSSAWDTYPVPEKAAGVTGNLVWYKGELLTLVSVCVLRFSLDEVLTGGYEEITVATSLASNVP
jgi:hypothetical protein